MANFELQISGNLDELSEIAARLSGGTFAPAGPAAVDASGLTAADKPKRASRTKSDEGSTTDATAASPATEPVTPITQQTAEQTKVVDPDVAAAQLSDGKTVVQPEPEAAEEVKPAPAATGAGEPTLDMLKDELGKLLKKDGFGAKAAQDLIRQHASGAASLTAVSATDYPALHAALVAANLG